MLLWVLFMFLFNMFKKNYEKKNQKKRIENESRYIKIIWGYVGVLYIMLYIVVCSWEVIVSMLIGIERLR